MSDDEEGIEFIDLLDHPFDGYLMVATTGGPKRYVVETSWCSLAELRQVRDKLTAAIDAAGE